jgi:hypothetical protein
MEGVCMTKDGNLKSKDITMTDKYHAMVKKMWFQERRLFDE